MPASEVCPRDCEHHTIENTTVASFLDSKYIFEWLQNWLLSFPLLHCLWNCWHNIMPPALHMYLHASPGEKGSSLAKARGLGTDCLLPLDYWEFSWCLVPPMQKHWPDFSEDLLHTVLEFLRKVCFSVAPGTIVCNLILILLATFPFLWSIYHFLSPSSFRAKYILINY